VQTLANSFAENAAWLTHQLLIGTIVVANSPCTWLLLTDSPRPSLNHHLKARAITTYREDTSSAG